MLVLVLRPRLATTTILALAALLTVNVIADLGLAQLMAAGRVRGDWELALAFSVVPVIGVVYALALLRTARAERSGKAQSGSGSLNRLMSSAAIPPGGAGTMTVRNRSFVQAVPGWEAKTEVI